MTLSLNIVIYIPFHDNKKNQYMIVFDMKQSKYVNVSVYDRWYACIYVPDYEMQLYFQKYNYSLRKGKIQVIYSPHFDEEVQPEVPRRYLVERSLRYGNRNCLKEYSNLLPVEALVDAFFDGLG